MVAAGVAANWGWVGLEPFLAGFLVEVAWARTGWGGLEVGGGDEGVALALGLVEGKAVATLVAATAAAREELGGEADSAGWDMAGGVGVAPWTGVVMGVDWLAGVAFGAMALGNCFFELWLLWGGVVLCWEGVPASLSTSMGEASIVRVVDAAMVYKQGAVMIKVVAASCEAGGLCFHGSRGCLFGAFGGRRFDSGWWGAEER